MVRFPSTLSLAVAPASLYVSPTESVMDDCPFKVITGAVVSGLIVIVLAIEDVLFDASFTVYVTV